MRDAFPMRAWWCFPATAFTSPRSSPISARNTRCSSWRRPARRDHDAGSNMTCMATRRGFIGGLASVAALAPHVALAAYPSRPVRILVPFPPGRRADLIARLISPRLAQSLGQPFFVENRAGAAGRIGTGVVAKSEPDGHTLLMTTESSLVIAPHVGVSLGYDPRQDFAPISLLTRNAVILVV